MKVGDLVQTNLFGEENSWGILIRVKKLPKDAFEYFNCSVLLLGGNVRSFSSSQLLTVEEVGELR